MQCFYLLGEGNGLLGISHTLIFIKKRSPTLVHWPCGREVWWDLSLQRYDFFLKLQAKSLKYLSKTGLFVKFGQKSPEMIQKMLFLFLHDYAAAFSLFRTNDFCEIEWGELRMKSEEWRIGYRTRFFAAWCGSRSAFGRLQGKKFFTLHSSFFTILHSSLFPLHSSLFFILHSSFFTHYTSMHRTLHLD